MYVYRWSQDLMYKNNVSNKERKEKDTQYPHYIPKKNNNNTLSLHDALPIYMRIKREKKQHMKWQVKEKHTSTIYKKK